MVMCEVVRAYRGDQKQSVGAFGNHAPYSGPGFTALHLFSPDERHFEVAGAYDIAMRSSKKRIDKAVIKGKSERLTQPGQLPLCTLKNKRHGIP